MSEVSAQTPIRTRRVRAYRGRGDVYSWLRGHHSQVAERLNGELWSLADLAGEVVRNGLKGRNGVTPTTKAVTKVWQRVCRDVAKVEALKSAKKRPIGGKFPSRISPAWRPQEVLPHTPPSVGVTASLALVAVSPDGVMPDFPTVDPSGAPLAEGHVFYRGRSMPRSAAENLVEIALQGMEMDRYK